MTANDWRSALHKIGLSVDEQTSHIFSQAKLMDLPAQATVFRQGDACRNYLIIVEGSIRVFTRAENGREIVLYRLGSGDSCVLTTSCLFGKSLYPAEGQTESQVRALAIPNTVFDLGIQQSASFRKLVFSAFTQHVHLLITLVEEVAFGKLDIRLARLLLEQENREHKVQTTHQALAVELGSAREVISRQLKELESRGMITLHRGSICINNHHDLQALAKQ